MKKTKKIPNTPKYKFGGGFDSKDKANVRNFIGNSAKMYADTALNAVGVDAFGAGKGVEYKGTSANKFNQASNVTGKVSQAIAPAVANVLLPGSGQVLSMGQQVAGGAYGKFGPQNEEGFNAYDSQGNPIMNENDKSAQVAQIAGQVGGVASGFMGGSPSGAASGAGGASGIMGMLGGMGGMGAGAELPIGKYGGYMKYAMGGMNMRPNAEVENNEMITSDTPPKLFGNGGIELVSNNPYGTPTYKTNGPSHDTTNPDGSTGIPINMKSAIINGKTINPLTKNKFTKDINVLAKMENKYTKNAENGDTYSNTNAKLILPILAQKKDYLNNLQNAIIANKEQRKALNRGELPQPSMDNEQMQPQGNVAVGKYGGMMNKMAMGGVQLPYYNINNDGTPKYGMGGIEENINIGSNNTTSANKKMSPEEWAKYNTSLGYQQDKGSAIGKYPAFYNPKEYAINDSGAYVKIGDVGKNVDYNNDPTYKPLNQYSYKPPVAKQVISTKKAIPERDPNRPTWNFNSGDNPSFGGVSYTNAAGTGKVIPPTTLKYGGKMPKFYGGGPYDPNDEYIDPSETAMIEARDSGQYYEDSAKQAAEQNAYRIGMNNAINDPYRRNSLMTPADPYGDPNAAARRDDRMSREAAEIAGTGSEGTSTTGTGGGNKYNNRDMALQGLGMVAGLSPKLAYLKNQGKKYDTQEFYGYDPTLMDPTQARKDEQYAYRQSLENLRVGATGNAANLLRNTDAQRNKTSANLGRINKDYDNANVAITNRGKEYNIGNRYAVDDINAKNKAAALNAYYATLDAAGKDVAQGTKDIRSGNQDNKKMKMLPEAFNSPQFAKFIKEYYS